MGNDQSILDDSVPTVKLEERNLASVAKLIKDGQAKRIVVMTGAGLSTAAGIPDFRSPETGLYANLARLNLPTAESVFDISYFRENPEPFYVLANELYPGNYHPTLSHVFITLLAKKGLLSKLYTQNIDCLERQAGVPDELIVEAHGSFATQRCIDCKTPFPDDVMKEHVLGNRVPHCANESCGGLVKPDIVFFGEALPSAFFRSLPLLDTADLALVMGTSLTVHPFASLPDHVPDDCPRVLFNMEQVGSLGSRADDVLSLGDCNMGICALADHLGWLEELNEMWREIVGDQEAERQMMGLKDKKTKMMHEMKELTKRMGDTTLENQDEDAKGEGEDSGKDAPLNRGEASAETSSAGREIPGSSGSQDDSSDEALFGIQDTTAAAAAQVAKPDMGKEQQELDVIHVGGDSSETAASEAQDIDSKIEEKAKPSPDSLSPPDVQADKKAEAKEALAPHATSTTEGAEKASKESCTKPLL
ncbi:unnamed protein product [Discula destructiva]